MGTSRNGGDEVERVPVVDVGALVEAMGTGASGQVAARLGHACREWGAVADDRDQRWDRASVHEFQGTYGDYVLGKVAKVLPQPGIGAR